MMALTARRFFAVEATQVDPVEESEFFSGLKMRNGTFKLTRPSRFADLDAEIASAISERAGGIRQVLDVGASIGSTTIDLADFLRALGASPSVIGTDLFVDAHLVDLAPGFRVLTDADGWPLQYDIAGLAVRAWVRRLDYFTLAVAPLLIARALLGPRLRRMVAEARTTPVKMESRALAGRSIQLVENDIFALTPDFVGRFDFVRAANILNLSYFPADQLAVAIANIRSYCRGPGTLLLVLRSRGSKHDGTLFELRTDGKFDVRARVGEGSEVERLIVGDNAVATGSAS
jgi:SAM-dependent methyltransferase